MPVVSQFFGISVFILYRDHEPPHFHARYAEYEVTVEIKNGMVRGNFPGRALVLLLEWWEIHQEELMVDWERSRSQEPLLQIAPLE